MSHAYRNVVCGLLAFAWPSVAAFGQSQPPSQPPPPSPSQNQASPQAQSPSQTQDKPDSVADAARKAKGKKSASTKGKVFTEDDLSGMKQDGVSVVGGETAKRPSRAPVADAGKEDAPNSEEYWRGKAQPILEEMSKIDQQIAQLKEDIKKYGIGGVDVATGMKDGVSYVHDRNGQIEGLEKKKADLKKQLDDLEEEGRKAGAQPSWFR